MNNRRLIFSVAIAAALVASLSADHPNADACFMRAPQPVQVVLDRIDVRIHDNVVQKSYDCHFRNPNGGAIVGGVCYMEIAPDAVIDDMTMIVNGQAVQAELLDLEKANEVFQDIVRQGGNPALLEYYGNCLVRTQVPNIPAGGTAVVKFKYTQTLRPMNGVYRLSMLNTNPKMNMQALDHAAVNIHITSTQPLKNLYSPTHPIAIDETVEEGIMVRWSQDNYLPKNPFVVYYALSDDPLGVNLLTHKDGDDGYFMVMLSPSVGADAVAEAEVMSKDIVFCVDVSGSMIEGGKLEQAKSALKYCIENLREGDRFNIVDFGTGVRSMADQLVAVDAGTRARALRYVAGLRARGGTAIQEALRESLKQFERDDRLKMIFFATDGVPTIGERDADKLLADIKQANTQGVRIFAFGEGIEVNTRFLDLLSHENRGESEYILPEEDIAKKIGAYFDKIGSPMLADVQIEVLTGESSQLRVHDIYPRPLRDLFRGDQIVVFGRYSGSGNATLRLSGRINGQIKAFDFPATFAQESLSHEFVPRLWAGRKVDFLLSQIRKTGDNSELIDEVIRLARRYGIVTPYTAYLAMPDVAANAPGAVDEQLRGRFNATLRREMNATAGVPRPMAPQESRQLLEDADRLRALRDSRGDAYAQAEAERRAAGQGGSALDVLRYIGAKTFYRHGNTWYDSTYDPEQHSQLTEITVNSDAYFDLLAREPRIAPFLAPGNVVVHYRNTWYRFKTPAPNTGND